MYDSNLKSGSITFIVKFYFFMKTIYSLDDLFISWNHLNESQKFNEDNLFHFKLRSVYLEKILLLDI